MYYVWLTFSLLQEMLQVFNIVFRYPLIQIRTYLQLGVSMRNETWLLPMQSRPGGILPEMLIAIHTL